MLKVWVAQENRKLDFIKIRIFYILKDIIKKVKGQSTEWEGVFQILSNEEVLSGLYKEFLLLNNKRVGKLKWAEDLERHFCKEDTQMHETYEKMLNIINH